MSSSENSKSCILPSSSSSSLRKSDASKMEYLYEISYLSETDKVPLTDLPLVNPYLPYTKPRQSISKTVRSLISPQKSQAKEFVQASKFDQHLLPATEKEQFVTLELPSHLPKVWLSEGYTHLHFGAVRFALTLHGRKGLPTVSRIALLDTRFSEYQHACIGTVETTLNAGTVLVTMFPNFNMPISDPQLLSALKVQVQIVGAVPSSVTYAATLHYQMVYRIQNHSLDFAQSQGTDDALLLHVESDHVPSCTYVPRQIPRAELLKLIPETWITSYEQAHKENKNSVPIQSTEPFFRKRPSGEVEIAFKRDVVSKRPSCFPTQFSYAEESIPIYAFDANGRPVYSRTDDTGHIFWDVCSCTSCLSINDDDSPPQRRKSKRNSQRKLHKAFYDKDPEVGLLGEPSGKFDYYVKYTAPLRNDDPIIPTGWDDDDDDCSRYHKKWDWDNNPPSSPSSMLMFHPPTQEGFPPLETFEKDHSTHSWKIKNSSTRRSDGSIQPLSAAEAALNWHSENAVQQNALLKKIDQSQQRIEKTIQQQTQTLLTPLQACRQRIEILHNDIMNRLQNQTPFDAQEREIKNLKIQLASLESNPMIPPSTPYYPSTFSNSQTGPLYSSTYEGSTSTLFTPEEWEQKKKPFIPSKKIRSTTTRQTQTSHSQESPPLEQPQMMIKNPISNFLQQTHSQTTYSSHVPSITNDISSDSESVESTERNSDKSENDNPPLYMADQAGQSHEPTVDEPEVLDDDMTEPHVTKNYYSSSSTSSTKFTFDDVPPSQWKYRLQEMKAWGTAELQKPSMTHTKVIK